MTTTTRFAKRASLSLSLSLSLSFSLFSRIDGGDHFFANRRALSMFSMRFMSANLSLRSFSNDCSAAFNLVST